LRPGTALLWRALTRLTLSSPSKLLKMSSTPPSSQSPRACTLRSSANRPPPVTRRSASRRYGSPSGLAGGDRPPPS
jgi:hypothetical protein